MLIEFSVENYRSFREKQTFSMVASASAERAGHGHVLETGLSSIPRVLSEACIYGANGAGKSSLIHAMRFMSYFVRNSLKDDPEDDILVDPFLFHSEWRDKPSEFEVIFIHEENLFQYGFVADHKRVWEEWLFCRPITTQRERQIFTRIYNPDTDSYDWTLNSEHLKGKRESWKEATRSDSLFLTTAVHLNASPLRAPFDWITDKWRLLSPETLKEIPLTKLSLQSKSQKSRVIDFLRSADISLADVFVQDTKDDEIDEQSHQPSKSKKLEDFIRRAQEDFEVFTVRADEKGEHWGMSLDDESTGTQALFSLAAPILTVLDEGLVLVVDELNTGLHPLAFQHLVELFASPKTNPNRAQLIFTTHDTSIADQECLGRDQIWIVEKSEELAASFVPYSDFKTRSGKGFQKAYLQGRFGGIPKVGR